MAHSLTEVVLSLRTSVKRPLRSRGDSSLALIRHVPGFQETDYLALYLIVLCVRDCLLMGGGIVASLPSLPWLVPAFADPLFRDLPLLRLDSLPTPTTTPGDSTRKECLSYVLPL